MSINRLVGSLVLMQAVNVLGQTPPGFAPQTNKSIAVSFQGQAVAAGAAVSLAATGDAPTVQLTNTNNSHVLLMIDLDAPTPAENSYSPLLHWLQPITAAARNQTSEAVAPYLGPAPPAGSPPHRYVLLDLSNPSLEFELPSGFPTSFETTESRLKFDLPGFMERGQFELLGASWFTTVQPSNETATGKPSVSESGSNLAVSAGIAGLCAIAMATAAFF